jgi:CubicO group peptidase (beta-lactamase class C family)
LDQATSPVEPAFPAERRARDIAQLIHTGDRAAARAYYECHFAPDLPHMPLDFLLVVVSTLYDQSRGVAIGDVLEATATSAALVLRGELTGIVQALVVDVDADPPHRVTGLGVRPAPQPPPLAPSAAAGLSGDLGGWLQRLADADVFSGAVALAHRGELLFTQAYGQANKDFGVPNTLETAFNLGSMNKMFTAVAMAQLVERGRVRFDDYLADFLPDFPTPEAARQIQLKHLLSHTAGLGSFFNEKFQSTSRARLRSVNDYLDLVREEPLQFPPGTGWAYSNTGFLVLGAVIEAVTGRDYFDHMRAALFEPLGMHRTECFELDRVNPNLAVGYDKVFSDDGGVTFRNNLFDHVIRGGPAGGGYSTVGDLVRFATALHNHEILTPATTELLLSPKAEVPGPGQGFSYGYGFGIDSARGIVGHSGGFPGISSNLDLFRRSGHVAVVLSNYGMASFPVATRLQSLVLQAS